jgi:hypothetical protein
MFEIKLSLQEANLILASLAKLPFEQVADLIGNIRQQAEPQLARVEAEAKTAQTDAAEATE